MFQNSLPVQEFGLVPIFVPRWLCLTIGELDVVILLLPQGHQVHIVLSVLQNILQLSRKTSPAPLAIRKLNEEDYMKIFCKI